MLITKMQLFAIERIYRLNKRETQIVWLLFEGVESNKELSERIGISFATTKMYLHILYAKLGVNSKFKVIIELSERIKSLSNET